MILGQFFFFFFILPPTVSLKFYPAVSSFLYRVFVHCIVGEKYRAIQRAHKQTLS